MPQTMHEVSAAEEFARNPDLKPEDVTTLRTWLDTQKHLPHISDEMLILFLHSCYYNMEKTKDCIETYYKLRTKTPQFFSNRDLSYPALAKASSASNFSILPKCDPSGHHIVYHGLREFDPTTYSQEEGIKLMIMTIDACLLSCGASEGLVILIDMQGFKLAHFTRISLSAIRKFVKYFQEGNPVRMKAMHFINVVPFIDTILTAVKPFLKKELKSLLHFHTAGMETLYECIPKECLPSDYGGELDSVEELNAQHNTRLQSLADFFLEEEKMRINEKKREKKKKKKPKEL